MIPTKYMRRVGKKKLIGVTKCRNREGKLSMSEQLIIVILYHLEGFKISNIIVNMQ